MAPDDTPGGFTIRPLFIDFDQYTDGDADFKKEIIGLMIENLVELQQAVRLFSQNNEAKDFHLVCHKVKPTLDMLADQELSDTVDQLKASGADPLRITLLDKLCGDIAQSLSKE